MCRYWYGSVELQFLHSFALIHDAESLYEHAIAELPIYV